MNALRARHLVAVILLAGLALVVAALIVANALNGEAELSSADEVR